MRRVWIGLHNEWIPLAFGAVDEIEPEAAHGDDEDGERKEHNHCF